VSGEDVVERLDKIAAILQMGFAPQLDAARKEIRGDEISAAILEATAEWTKSGVVQEAVANQTEKSTRTVRDTLAKLSDRGIITARGGGRNLEYQRTGLV
jgi:transcription initiation factor IIE alpha subunit